MENFKRYIQDLEKINPTEEELAKTESSHFASDKYTSTFTIKIVNSDNLDESNPVLTIVENCDTTAFEVFAIAFFEEIKDVYPYKIFGRDEADKLAINEKTGEIIKILYTVLNDYETGPPSDTEIDQEYIVPVASSQENFLTALYYACSLQSKIIKEEIGLWSEEDLAERCKFAEQCTKEAGGDRYHSYWHQLSNCFR